MNLDEAVDLVMFAFIHVEPGVLLKDQRLNNLAKAVQQLFGDT